MPPLDFLLIQPFIHLLGIAYIHKNEANIGTQVIKKSLTQKIWSVFATARRTEEYHGTSNSLSTLMIWRLRCFNCWLIYILTWRQDRTDKAQHNYSIGTDDADYQWLQDFQDFTLKNWKREKEWSSRHCILLYLLHFTISYNRSILKMTWENLPGHLLDLSPHNNSVWSGAVYLWWSPNNQRGIYKLKTVLEAILFKLESLSVPVNCFGYEHLSDPKDAFCVCWGHMLLWLNVFYSCKENRPCPPAYTLAEKHQNEREKA